jgi:hypothetical protein
MTAAEGRKMLSEAKAQNPNEKSKVNPAFTRIQVIELIERGISQYPDDKILIPLMEKRVYQVCRNQRRPKY